MIPFRSHQVKATQTASEKNRRENKAPPESFEKRAISVGANHSRHVMAHRAEGGDKKVNVLCAPARLREREQRQNQQRRADVENQVAPTAQNPWILFRYSCWYGRYSLRPGKSSNVLHVAGDWIFPDSDEKSTLHSAVRR